MGKIRDSQPITFGLQLLICKADNILSEHKCNFIFPNFLRTRFTSVSIVSALILKLHQYLFLCFAFLGMLSRNVCLLLEISVISKQQSLKLFQSVFVAFLRVINFVFFFISSFYLLSFLGCS